ncbi:MULTISPECIES: hypothetical protein [Pseudomonas]|jgi:hypothetical protein|uniref:Uncharacterized protein n=2 Tax=Pseudomonas TaxID=286 RepID=A0A7X1GIT2_9PSED|nr:MULTISPECIES: hypothetical protein [Pseudomonas]MBC2693194.1 hypothetical protein [Pseudomonas kielensis]MDD1011049.1 hypothetical protein [Pseudomonas shahriarae]
MSADGNPFAIHRDKLIGADYSAALSLQAFVLSLYNGNTWKFRGDSLSNFDEEHFHAFCQLAGWYRRFTEGCPVFMATCREMIAERRKWAAINLSELEKLRATDPADFDGSASDLYYCIEQCEKRYENDQAHYLIGRDD